MNKKKYTQIHTTNGTEWRNDTRIKIGINENMRASTHQRKIKQQQQCYECVCVLFIFVGKIDEKEKNKPQGCVCHWMCVVMGYFFEKWLVYNIDFMLIHSCMHLCICICNALVRYIFSVAPLSFSLNIVDVDVSYISFAYILSFLISPISFAWRLSYFEYTWILNTFGFLVVVFRRFIPVWFGVQFDAQSSIWWKTTNETTRMKEQKWEEDKMSNNM